ncbi:hypothetical protein VPG91_11665 [Nitrospirillum amazonense]|uniref:hypothetical protein n=1 Tax=Nitrospirillum amazonense TaxID=28077 RepID=UPI002DD42F67|nr:hypothetical protein [Nitrospirillum amazonense]MEC4591647.1 hypothetical protein [Nitrospirillum amazonense]
MSIPPYTDYLAQHVGLRGQMLRQQELIQALRRRETATGVSQAVSIAAAKARLNALADDADECGRILDLMDEDAQAEEADAALVHHLAAE